jgi:transposase-like protein
MLNWQQRSALLAALRPAIGLDRVCDTIEGARPAPLCCPDCGASRHYRHGVNRGLQRYRCRACGRTFNALSGTPLARLRHREKWLAYSKEMLDSRSVRAAAKAAGAGRWTATGSLRPSASRERWWRLSTLNSDSAFFFASRPGKAGKARRLRCAVS